MTGWQLLGVTWALGALLTAGGSEILTNRGRLDFGGRLLVCVFVWPLVLVASILGLFR